MISRTVTITSPLGMHARAAARFVHAATAFESQVRVALGHRERDGKSIMGLLLLAAAKGSLITITASGSDEDQAVKTLCRLVESGFGEAA